MSPKKIFSSAWTAPFKERTTLLFANKRDINRSFSKRASEVNRNSSVGRYTHSDLTDGISKAWSVAEDITSRGRLRSSAIGSFTVASPDVRTFVTDRNETIERVSAHHVASEPPPSRAAPFAFTQENLVTKVRTGTTYTADKIVDYLANCHDTTKFPVKGPIYRTLT